MTSATKTFVKFLMALLSVATALGYSTFSTLPQVQYSQPKQYTYNPFIQIQNNQNTIPAGVDKNYSARQLRMRG